MRSIVKILATFFYLGYFPIARGTLAALAASALFYFIKGSLLGYALTTLFLILSGFLVSGEAEKIFGRKDASEVVIDDACGMLVALFLIPQSTPYIIAAFIIYRVFDIIKIPPLKRLENLKGGAGIMLDDIAAGIYANIILQSIRYMLYAIR